MERESSPEKGTNAIEIDSAQEEQVIASKVQRFIRCDPTPDLPSNAEKLSQHTTSLMSGEL